MSLIEDYKQKYINIRTSEAIFSISPPPDHQCGNITELIKKIKKINKMISKYNSMDEDELRETLSDVDYEISDMDSDLDEISQTIEDVRQWGQEWKDFAKWLVEENKMDIDDLAWMRR